MSKKQTQPMRYLTVSRVALELVCSMGAEENALFNRQLFSAFQQLEHEQKPEYKDTDNPILNIALREAFSELHRGYEIYDKRRSARQQKDQGPITDASLIGNDVSPTDHRPTAEEEVDADMDGKMDIGNKCGTEVESAPPYPTTAAVITVDQRAEIEAKLKELGIIADATFWNTAFAHGFDATNGAIQRAQYTGILSLSYLTSTIRQIAESGVRKDHV